MKEKKDKRKNKRVIEIMDIIIFSIVFIIYLIALLCFFPGILTGDCVDQINQAVNNVYYAGHPILHSFIIGNLTRIGGVGGTWVAALFQIIVFSLIWTYLCKVLRKYNPSKLNKVLQIVFTILITCLPLNFIYAITLWKDILYTYAILLLLVLIYIGIMEKYKYNLKQIILISLSTSLIMKLRHNGLPIGIIMFAILFILNIIYNRDKKSIIKFLVSFIICIIVLSLPEKLVNKVEIGTEGGSILDSTKIYCMGGLLNTDIELEEDEKVFLNQILDIDVWKEGYNPYTGSGILFNKDLKGDVLLDKNNRNTFDNIFKKYSMQKKDFVKEHFIQVNSIWWSVEELGGMHSIVLSNSWISEMSNGIYDNKPVIKKGDEYLIKHINKTLEIKKLYEFIYRPATALYLSIFMVICIIVKTKKFKDYILVLFPMALNTGTYILLISSQDQRYFYPSFITEYFLVMLFINTFIQKKKRTKEKKELEINNENSKVLVIVPAYNEEKSIQKVINNIDKQKIDNCDILIVNDGSLDNTSSMAKKTKKAIVIDLPNNLGIGGAVQTGYIYAKNNNYDIAIQIDGDGQHDAKYLKDMIEEVKKGNDLVIGSRFIKKTNYKQTFLRMLGINIISLVIRIISHNKIFDTTSGFRAANKRVIYEFVEDYPYDYPEPCTNMTILNKGYKVKEIPVEMNKRETGVSSISQLKSVIYMLKVIMYLIIKGIVD